MKLKQQEFYCVKCRKRVKSSPSYMCVKTYKNKRMKGGKSYALRSFCQKCDTNLTKFISPKEEVQLAKKYGRC